MPETGGAESPFSTHYCWSVVGYRGFSIDGDDVDWTD